MTTTLITDDADTFDPAPPPGLLQLQSPAAWTYIGQRLCQHGRLILLFLDQHGHRIERTHLRYALRGGYWRVVGNINRDQRGADTLALRDHCCAMAPFEIRSHRSR